MILSNPAGLIGFNQKVLVHKHCGGYVEAVRGLPHAYTCPKCRTLLHENNAEWVPHYSPFWS